MIVVAPAAYMVVLLTSGKTPDYGRWFLAAERLKSPVFYWMSVVQWVFVLVALDAIVIFQFQ